MLKISQQNGKSGAMYGAGDGRFHSPGPHPVTAKVTPDFQGTYVWDYGGLTLTGKTVNLPRSAGWVTNTPDTVTVTLTLTNAVPPVTLTTNCPVWYCAKAGDPTNAPPEGTEWAPEEQYCPRCGVWWKVYHQCGHADNPGHISIPGGAPEPPRPLVERGTLPRYYGFPESIVGFCPHGGPGGGLCCPCPEHRAHHTGPATLVSYDPRLVLLRKGVSGALVTLPLGFAVQRGEQVYARTVVDAVAPPPSSTPWDARAVFTWEVEGGGTEAQTNAFTLLGMYFLPFLWGPDSDLGSDSVLMGVHPPPEGWVFPPGTLNKMRLDTFIGMPGRRVLSLDSTAGGFRAWFSADTNAPPQLTPGTAITNSLPGNSLWFMADTLGTATLTYEYTGSGIASNFNHTTRYTLTSFRPDVWFERSGATPVSALHVSMWINAFEMAGDEVRVKNEDFIARSNNDYFRVRLRDGRRTESTVEVTLSESAVGGISTNITLTRQRDGSYTSARFIVIADNGDRNPTTLAEAGAFPGIGSRMFLGGLDDTLTATYAHNGAACTNVATVGVDVKTLELDIAVMIVNGKACVTNTYVEKAVKMTCERFAQADILVTNVNLTYFNAPEIVATNMAHWIAYEPSATTTNKRALTAETRAIIEASGLSTNRMRVIYAPGPFRCYEGNVLKNPAGFAIADYAFQPADSDYLDTCFVEADIYENYRMPHEITHLFGWRDHDSQPWYLMYRDGGGYVCEDVRSVKRLNQEEISTLRADGRRKLK